jgi:uroporphyrinogen-III synthase
VQSFIDQAGALKLAKDARRPLAGSIGPQTSETMKRTGMPIDFEAKKPSLDALVDALLKKIK